MRLLRAASPHYGSGTLAPASPLDATHASLRNRAQGYSIRGIDRVSVASPKVGLDVAGRFARKVEQHGAPAADDGGRLDVSALHDHAHQQWQGASGGEFGDGL